MKLHHIALAMIGWYLMIPPVMCHPRPNLVEGNTVTVQDQCECGPDSALYEWDLESSFDRADDCEAERSDLAQTPVRQLRRDLRDVAGGTPLGVLATAVHDANQSALCIASDDPRLVKAPAPAPEPDPLVGSKLTDAPAP